MCLALVANGAFCFPPAAEKGCRKLANGSPALGVILEIACGGTLEALTFIHRPPFSFRTAAVVSPLSGDCGGEKKTPKQTTTLNH